MQTHLSKDYDGRHLIVVASYQSYRRDQVEIDNVVPSWYYNVLDEGHLIKNPKTSTYRAVTSIHSKHRIVLTGTPIQNDVIEIWPLFHFLLPGGLGTARSFDQKYTKHVRALRSAGKRSTKRMREEYILAVEDLHVRVSPMILRRTKIEVALDLPEKTIQNVMCEKSEQQEKHFVRFVEAEVLERNEGKDKTSPLVRMQYLRLLCSHPTLVSPVMSPKNTEKANVRHSGKMVALLRLLAEAGIGNGPPKDDEKEILESTFTAPTDGWSHKVLIFTHFKKTLEYLEKSVFGVHLKGIKYIRLDGGVAPKHRGAVVSNFNNSKDVACLLTTTRTGGVGLTLTAADTVIFLEPDWNPTVDAQAMDRAHRIGQKKTVSVYRLITAGTLEEQIMDVQAFKINTARDVLSGVQSTECGGGGETSSISLKTNRDVGLTGDALPFNIHGGATLSFSSSSSGGSGGSGGSGSAIHKVEEEYELYDIEKFVTRLNNQ